MSTTRGAVQGMKISAGSDRDIIPLVRIPPDYPPRAQQRGIEGWVLIEFTISPSGTVSDPKVLDADPKGMFEDAALKAISRWRSTTPRSRTASPSSAQGYPGRAQIRPGGLSELACEQRASDGRDRLRRGAGHGRRRG